MSNYKQLPSMSDIYAGLDNLRLIAAVWGIDDVKELRPDLSDDQAWEVLEMVQANHDAEMGISHSTLQWTAYDLFGGHPDEKNVTYE